MSEETMLELIEKVDVILKKTDEEISVKEKLEAIKLKLELIRSFNKLGYQFKDEKNQEIMHGLIVLQPHADMLISGIKTEEFRSRPPPMYYYNNDIYLLSECKILGIIRIVDYTEDSPTNYRWKIKVVDEFIPPRLYNHPTGARVWVRNVGMMQTKLV